MLERGSILLFSFQGIPVRLHWSFGLLVLWVYYIGVKAGMGWTSIGVLGLLILSLFVCVIMHEFGHALAARRYGVRTRDIILSPIGGVARLDHIPEKPFQELVVAIAGPLVNVAIAAVLGIVAWLWVPHGVAILGESESAVYWIGNYVPLLFWMNLWLVVFNLIPAFPMDGGRILRALLAMRQGRLKATKWAAGIGRALAIGFILIAIFRQELFLGLIGVFIFLMATQEYKSVKADHLYKRFFARDVTRHNFTLLHAHTTVNQALHHLQHGLETNFIIGDDPQHPEGYILADDLQKAKAKGHEETAIIHFKRPISGVLAPDTPLVKVFAAFQQNPLALILVLEENGSVLGVLDRDQIDHVLFWANRVV